MTLTPRPPHVPPERVVDFDIYAPPGVKADYHGAWKSLQAPGIPEIIWTPRNGGHWIPTRAAVINEVMSDYERFSSRVIMIPKVLGADHNLIPTTMDPPEHRPYRNILNDALAPKVVGRIESMIRNISINLIEKVRKDGACDFTTAYAEIFPIQIFLTMMDLPIGDTHQTKYWADQLLRPDGTMTFAEAMKKLFDYLEPHVGARMGRDGQDMLSKLVNGRVGDRTLTKDEALNMAVQVFIAGLDTVVNFLGFVFLFLARHPEQRRQLVADPGLIPAAVEEFLRRHPIVTIGREITRDMEFRGVSLKAGEMIATPTPLGGLDEQEYQRPLEVDFHRENKKSLTFGTGHHRCPGTHLARAEVRITLEEWMQRIPDFSLAPNAEVTFTGGVVGVVDTLPLVWRTG